MMPQSPFQILPDLSDEAFRGLKRDIAANGVLVPLFRDENGALLDGHHRLRAIGELRDEGVTVPEPPVTLRVGYSPAENRLFIRSLHLHRRSLTATQRRALVEDQLRDLPDMSDRSIASALAISPSTVGTVRRKIESDNGTVQIGHSRLGLDGRTCRISKRTILATSEPEARRALGALAMAPDTELPDRTITAQEAAAAARTTQRETNRDARFAKLAGASPFPSERRFSVLYIDVPWQYSGASDPIRQAERHYDTMSQASLIALPVDRLAAVDAIAFLWATPPKVAEAVELLNAWGFEFKTSACWVKEQPASATSARRTGAVPRYAIGLGSYYRQSHELRLVGTRGNIPPPAPSNRPCSVISAPRGAHSAKPAMARRQIEKMYPLLSRIELFARGEVPGWHVWGLEAKTGITALQAKAGVAV